MGVGFRAEAGGGGGEHFRFGGEFHVDFHAHYWFVLF